MNKLTALDVLRKIKEQHSHQLPSDLIEEISNIIESEEAMTYEESIKIMEIIIKAISIIEKIADFLDL